MSPEQVQGARNIDGQSDLYSLGTIAYHECLSGQPVFAGGNAHEICRAHLAQTAPRLDELDLMRQIPKDVADLVSDLLEKKPRNRPTDAQALRRRADQLFQYYRAQDVQKGLEETAADLRHRVVPPQSSVPPVWECPLKQGQTNTHRSSSLSRHLQRPIGGFCPLD